MSAKIRFNIRLVLAIGAVLLALGAAVWFSGFGRKKSFSVERPPGGELRTFFADGRGLSEPFGVAVKGGHIYVSDGQNGRILLIDPNGPWKIITDRLNTPSAIAFDSTGDLIVADSGDHTIKKVSIKTGRVELLAGTPGEIGYADGPAEEAFFNAPVGVAVGPDDRIYVADTYNDRIRLIEKDRVLTFAGNVRGFADGNRADALFDTPCGLALTADGHLLVADSGNARLRVIEENGQVWTLAGSGRRSLTDGFYLQAGFVRPADVEISSDGVIYVADQHAVRALGRRFLPVVETLIGADPGYRDGPLGRAFLNRPSGLAVDRRGDLFIADAENRAVRVLTDRETGRLMSSNDIDESLLTADGFRALAPPRWPFNPAAAEREIAGTFGEIRGEIESDPPPPSARFHNGLDITGRYGETALFVRDEKVLDPFAVQNFATLRELIRLPDLAYIHIRIGRDENDDPYDDRRFQFLFREDQTPRGLRIPRGTVFLAGDPIGTLNRMNHVHLVAGSTRRRFNGLDALILPGAADTRPPVIEDLRLYDENWKLFETEPKKERIKLAGKTRIVVSAYDLMDKNPERRRLGLYRVGYQLLRGEKPLGKIDWTITFDRLPPDGAIGLIYAAGSRSGATGQTVFNYIASNRVNGDNFNEDFLNAGKLASGDYTLRVFAADFFGNQSFKDQKFRVGDR